MSLAHIVVAVMLLQQPLERYSARKCLRPKHFVWEYLSTARLVLVSASLLRFRGCPRARPERRDSLARPRRYVVRRATGGGRLGRPDRRPETVHKSTRYPQAVEYPLPTAYSPD